MKNILLICILSFVLLGCNKKKISELESRIVELESEIVVKDSIIEKHNRYDRIRESLRIQEELEENKIRKYSNSEIINIVREKREFDCRNYILKDFRVIRVNENIYDVSYLIQNKDPVFSDRWHSAMYRIEFFKDNKYRLTMKKDISCM